MGVLTSHDSSSMGSRVGKNSRSLQHSTPQASDTILGSGWATQGYSATSIEGRDRGVGLLLSEGGVPVRLKAYYLSDDDLKILVARAEALRRVDVEAAP